MTGLVATRQLKAARALAGLTQQALGHALGVDGRQIRFWERRLPKSPTKLSAIEAAVEAHGVTFLASPNAGVQFTGAIERPASLA
jgi:transcriptional regulator with XRE-family HTH domain